MTVRDKTGLKTQITDLIDSGGIPKVTAANLRSVLTDLVDSLGSSSRRPGTSWSLGTIRPPCLPMRKLAAGGGLLHARDHDSHAGRERRHRLADLGGSACHGDPDYPRLVIAVSREQFVIRNSDTAGTIVTPYDGVAYKWWRTNRSITVSSNAGRIYEIRYRRT